MHIILQVITIIILLCLFFWQKKKIDLLDKYTNIIKIDEINKFVELSKKSFEIEFESKLKKAIEENVIKLSSQSSVEITKLENTLKFMEDMILASINPLRKYFLGLNKYDRNIEIEKIDNDFLKIVFKKAFKDFDIN